MSEPTPEPCPYCGHPDTLRANAFFSHPVCGTCLRAWYEAGRELTPAELREESRSLRAGAPGLDRPAPGG